MNKIGLEGREKSFVKNFSGGMRRRVSVALSCIGDSKVIIMDEPTTGMDPKSRLKIWRLIEEVKKDRVVVLTTHAMEEADQLATRIAIMVKGKVAVLGNSMYLKSKFGDDYRLSVICKAPEMSNEVLEVVRTIIPGINVVDSNGGSLVFGVSNGSDLRQIVKYSFKLQAESKTLWTFLR